MNSTYIDSFNNSIQLTKRISNNYVSDILHLDANIVESLSNEEHVIDTEIVSIPILEETYEEELKIDNYIPNLTTNINIENTPGAFYTVYLMGFLYKFNLSNILLFNYFF
jgi:hypothetical protein